MRQCLVSIYLAMHTNTKNCAHGYQHLYSNSNILLKFISLYSLTSSLFLVTEISYLCFKYK